MSPPPVNASGPLFLALAAALVPVLFAYGGWQQTNFIAEEIVEPEKNLPRALVLGVIIVVIVYVLANLTYLRTLGAGGLAASTAPAADAMRVAVGPVGSTFISAGIAASTFGFLNLVILVSPRVYRTMAADGLFFPQLATLHPKFRTPTTAIVVQGLWAILLLFSGVLRTASRLRGVLRLDLLRQCGRRPLRLSPPGPGGGSGARPGGQFPGPGLSSDAFALRGRGGLRSGGLDLVESRERASRLGDPGGRGASVLVLEQKAERTED